MEAAPVDPDNRAPALEPPAARPPARSACKSSASRRPIKRGTAPEAVAEKTAVDVPLTVLGDRKISVVKELCEILSLGFKQAEDLVESEPTPIKAGIAKAEAEEIKRRLQAAGATIEIQNARPHLREV